jgi:CheY-like chemotaxis protein
VTAVEVQAVICKLRELAPEAVLQPMTLIAITGYDDEEARMRSREAGFDAHLVKPVPLDVSVAILSRFGTEARRIGRSPGS